MNEPPRRQRKFLRRLGGLLRIGLGVGAVFAFCRVADRYRLSPRPDWTPADALSLGGVRWAYQSESDENRLAIFREPKDPLHLLGLGTAAAYVFDLRSNRLTDWAVDTFRDEAFEGRQQLFHGSGWRRITKEEALRLLESRERNERPAGAAAGKFHFSKVEA